MAPRRLHPSRGRHRRYELPCATNPSRLTAPSTTTPKIWWPCRLSATSGDVHSANCCHPGRHRSPVGGGVGCKSRARRRCGRQAHSCPRFASIATDRRTRHGLHLTGGHEMRRNPPTTRGRHPVLGQRAGPVTCPEGQFVGRLRALTDASMKSRVGGRVACKGFVRGGA